MQFRYLSVTDPLVGLYWFDAPAFSITDDTHHLGSRQNTCIMITSSEGHVLIDTDFGNGSEYFLLSDVINLGFNPKDIRYIILTHNHPDHVGGAKLLRQITGAQVIAHKADACGIEKGEHPHLMETDGASWDIPGCSVDIKLESNQELIIGSKVINIIHTPGHTAGCLTITWNTDFLGKKYTTGISGICGVASFASLLEGQVDFPAGESPGDFENSLKKLKNLNIDFFLAVHQFCNNTWRKYELLKAGRTINPFIDPEGWKNWLLQMSLDLDNLKSGIDIWNGKGWVSEIDMPEGVLDPRQEPRRKYHGM